VSSHLNSREEFLQFLIESGLNIPVDSSNYIGFMKGYRALDWVEVDADSLALMQIAINLEERYDLKMAPEDLVTIKSVEALFERLNSRKES
jgi:hypothetical protein